MRQHGNGHISKNKRRDDPAEELITYLKTLFQDNELVAFVATDVWWEEKEGEWKHQRELRGFSIQKERAPRNPEGLSFADWYALRTTFQSMGQGLFSMQLAAFDGVVSAEKVDAVLIHAGAFFLRVFRETPVEAFRNTEFELSGITRIRSGIMDRVAVCNGGFKPRFLCVKRIGDRFLRSLTDGETSGKIREGDGIPAFIGIRYKDHAIGH